MQLRRRAAGAFSYDDNGNQTERAVALVPDRTITWDADNRPSLVAAKS